MEHSNYFLQQKQDLTDILQHQNGVIDYKIMQEIFYSRDIASGQTSYKAKTIALLEYLLIGKPIIIRENETTAEIYSQEQLAGYYQKKEPTFKSFKEELAPYLLPN